MSRKLIFALLLSLSLGAMAFAQSSGGQICIRAFEDRNGNGQQDANEPPITRGLTATLADGQGVIINTSAMETSPNASSGTLCFQRLEAGQYTMRVVSADYNATTPNEFISAVSDTGVPQVFPFGGQVIPIEIVPQNTSTGGDLSLSPAEQRAAFIRLLFAGIGAVVIMGAMTVVGALIYFFALRNKAPQKRSTGQYASVRSTGSYAAVPSTGQFLKPDTGQYPKLSDTDIPVSAQRFDDTDAPKARPTSPDIPYDKVDDGFQFEDEDPNAVFKPPQE